MALSQRERQLIRTAIAFQEIREELLEVVNQPATEERQQRAAQLEVQKAQLFACVERLSGDC